MTIKFDLVKTTETLKLELTKHDVKSIIPCQVKVAMDVSGSFNDEHIEGYTQDLLNRFVPFALIFDKDGVIDSYTFSHVAGRLPLINKENFSDYILEEVVNCRGYRGGTSYVPVLELIDSDASPVDVTVTVSQETKKSGFLGRLFGKTETTTEVKEVVSKGVVEKEIVFFVTDGDADDTAQAKKFIERMGRENVFFVFISIGYDVKLFRESFKDTPFSIYLTLSKAQIRDLQNWSDEKIYEMLLQPSLIDWMNKEV